MANFQGGEGFISLDDALKLWRDARVDFASTRADLSALKNKGIFITGGASGLGAAFTIAFADAGANVVIGDVNTKAGQAFEQDCRDKGRNVSFIECDVTSYASQLAAFKKALSILPSPGLSHVIANAGVAGHLYPFPSDADYDGSSDPPEPMLSQIEISLKGMYYTMYLGTHYLGQRGKSSDDRSILLVGSLASYRGILRRPDYCAAKFGVRGMLKAMRPDLRASTGLRINMLAPSYISTPLTEQHRAKIEEAGYVYAKLEDAIEAVMRLTSDETAYGRSVCIGTKGPFDLEDDPAGLDGGMRMKDILESGDVPPETS